MTRILDIQVATPPEVTRFGYMNGTITVNNQSSPVESALHYALDTEVVQLAADIAGTDANGPFVVQVNMPGYLGLPFVRLSNGEPTSDETYLKTTIVNGHVLAEGKLPHGAWTVLPDRVDTALAKINAPFRINLPTITFIVSRG